MLRQKLHVGAVSSIALVVAATAALTPTPTVAKKGLGTALGVVGGLIILNEAAKAMNNQGSPQKSGKSGGGGASSGGGRERVETDTGRREEISTDHVTDRLADQQRERNQKAEQNRNVELAVNRFLYILQCYHDPSKTLQSCRSVRTAQINISERATKSTGGVLINQVTAGEVKRAVEQAYRDERLGDFERFAVELWTRDRLTVEVLREAEMNVEPFFRGVGSKGPSMQDLEGDNGIMRKAAREVYARALELSEIIGVSHSFDRFIRTIYENSDRAPENLVTVGADNRYERLLSKSINSIDRRNFIVDGPVVVADRVGLERQFQYRFRARRALYDCLSSNYVELLTGSPPRDSGKLMQTGVVSINTIQIGASQRGATLENPGIGKQAAGGMAKPSERPIGSAANVWERVQVHVKDKCQQPMLAVAETARSRGLQPIPARWDNTTSQQGGPSQSGQQQPLIPITITPSR